MLDVLGRAPGPLAGLEVAFEPLQDGAIHFGLIVARQLVFSEQRARTVELLQPLVERGATLGVGVRLERHGATGAAGELLRVRLQRHHVGGGEFARHNHRHVRGLGGAVLLNQRCGVALPEREQLAFGVVRQRVHGGADRFGGREVARRWRVVGPAAGLRWGRLLRGLFCVFLGRGAVVPDHHACLRHPLSHGGEVFVGLRLARHTFAAT